VCGYLFIRAVRLVTDRPWG